MDLSFILKTISARLLKGRWNPPGFIDPGRMVQEDGKYYQPRIPM
jgi:hypothetical protein